MSVYFAQRRRRGCVKIGWSRSVPTRLAAVGAKHLLGAMPGNREKEIEVHERFAHIRVRGEWFRPTEELLEYVKTHAQGHVPDHETKSVPIRLPKSLLEQVDDLAESMSEPGMRVTRADVLRLAAHRGVDQLEGERKRSR